VRRSWLTYNFQPFPRKDPNLPRRLLPDPWVGYGARQLFTDYRRLLSLGMGDFIDQLARVLYSKAHGGQHKPHLTAASS